MLDRLLIKNYRKLREITFSSLGRVNLIIGENNTGKTSVLDAIRLYASQMSISTLYDLLKERNEIYATTANPKKTDYKKSILSLFPNRSLESLSDDKRLVIQTKDKDSILTHFLSLRLIWFKEESDNKTEVILHEDIAGELIKPGFKIEKDTEVTIYSRREFNENRKAETKNPDAYNFQLYNTKSCRRMVHASDWEAILESDKENEITEILRTIEPQVKSVVFIPEKNNPAGGNIELLMEDGSSLPIQSMGIGVSRSFYMMLLLLNSKDGFFLIDEFENGLHYTLQEKLMKVIFRLSAEMNIQVFMTTQSQDCITAFYHALLMDEYANKGKLIRLSNVAGHIEGTEVNTDELKVISENKIDLR